MKAEQYEVVIVNLDPTIGSEIKKTRPCLILSPDEMNRYLNTIVIAPITSQSRDYPTRVPIELDGRENWVVIDQIRTIDKSRIVKKLAKVNKQETLAIKAILRQTFVD